MTELKNDSSAPSIPSVPYRTKGEDSMKIAFDQLENAAGQNPELEQAIQASTEQIPYHDLDPETAYALDILAAQLAIRDACANATTVEGVRVLPDSRAVAEALAGQSLTAYRSQAQFQWLYGNLSSRPPALRYALSTIKSNPALTALAAAVMKLSGFSHETIGVTSAIIFGILTLVSLLRRFQFPPPVKQQLSLGQRWSRDKAAIVAAYQNVEIKEEVYLLHELMSEIAEIDLQRKALMSRTPKGQVPLINGLKHYAKKGKSSSDIDQSDARIYIPQLLRALKQNIQHFLTPDLIEKFNQLINLSNSSYSSYNDFYRAVCELEDIIKKYPMNNTLKEVYGQIEDLKRKRFILMGAFNNFLHGRPLIFSYEVSPGQKIEYIYTAKKSRRVKKNSISADPDDKEVPEENTAVDAPNPDDLTKNITVNLNAETEQTTDEEALNEEARGKTFQVKVV